jgi:hypothetical protein
LHKVFEKHAPVSHVTKLSQSNTMATLLPITRTLRAREHKQFAL